MAYYHFTISLTKEKVYQHKITGKHYVLRNLMNTNSQDRQDFLKGMCVNVRQRYELKKNFLTLQDVLNDERNNDSPFIVKVKWLIEDQVRKYLAVEFMEGGQLSHITKRERCLSLAQVRFIATELVEAMQHLMRYSKRFWRVPQYEDIMLDESYHVKWDIGFEPQAPGDGIEYIPPEVLYGSVSVPLPASSGWWFLGNSLYETCIGLPPFYSPDIPRIYQKVLTEDPKFPTWADADFAALVTGLLTKDPIGRDEFAKGIKSHPFFKGVDWEKVASREEESPLRRELGIKESHCCCGLHHHDSLSCSDNDFSNFTWNPPQDD